MPVTEIPEGFSHCLCNSPLGPIYLSRKYKSVLEQEPTLESTINEMSPRTPNFQSKCPVTISQQNCPVLHQDPTIRSPTSQNQKSGLKHHPFSPRICSRSSWIRTRGFLWVCRCLPGPPSMVMFSCSPLCPSLAKQLVKKLSVTHQCVKCQGPPLTWKQATSKMSSSVGAASPFHKACLTSSSHFTPASA